MNFVKSGDCITVVSDTVYTFDKSHKNYDILVKAIKESDEQTFVKHFNVGNTISTWSKNGFTMNGGVLYYGEEVVADEIANIVMDMISEGFDETPILNFMVKLYKNPAKHVVDQLYSWLSHKSLAITPDGDFFTYKSVSIHSGETIIDKHGREVKEGDFVSSYSGPKYRNNVGDINEMPRRQVCDNRNVACSDGFHVGTIEYINTHYTKDINIICKVNPEDVVSIPIDCNNQKIRCCKYEVVSVMKGELKIVETVESYEDRFNPFKSDNPEFYTALEQKEAEEDMEDEDDDLCFYCGDSLCENEECLDEDDSFEDDCDCEEEEPWNK